MWALKRNFLRVTTTKLLKMEQLKLNIEKAFDFVSKEQVFNYKSEIEKHNKALHDKTGKGNDFVGWVDLPASVNDADLKDLETTTEKIKANSEVLVVVGIGGSYLGARAVIDALSHSFSRMQSENKNPLVLFAGQNIGEDYMYELLEILKDKSYSVCVISKSGTTTEPAIAFRILKQDLEQRYGANEAHQRIVAITDKSRGALRQLANERKLKTYIIPDDVGGRYSVFTPVGLLPIAVAGFDIRKLIAGATEMQQQTNTDVAFEENPAALYAATRNALYQQKKTIEILVNFNPKLHYIAEWWKQLYGESEGKEGVGIFPASVDFTTDLHSMGQYIQEGIRNIFETVISIQKPKHQVQIPDDDANLDKLNYLAGKRIDQVNKMAELGTAIAHMDGGVPNLKIELPELNEYYLGQLLYFFEKACGLSGYALGINPFDQPGVEAYKTNMFALLEKPGYEEKTKELKSKI